jgi:hypothetical protein
LGVVFETGSDGGTKSRNTEVEKMGNRGPDRGGPIIFPFSVDVINDLCSLRGDLLKRHTGQVIIHAVDKRIHATDETTARSFVVTV